MLFPGFQCGAPGRKPSSISPPHLGHPLTGSLLTLYSFFSLILKIVELKKAIVVIMPVSVNETGINAINGGMFLALNRETSPKAAEKSLLFSFFSIPSVSAHFSYFTRA